MDSKTKITVYCPRCDRKYSNKKNETYKELMDNLIRHVSFQHPDHDPMWYDTYPSPV